MSSDTGLLYNAINNMAPPIGSVITIADSLTPIAASGAIEYLQSGILTAIAPYPNLEATAPWITANLGMSSGTPLPVASQSLRGVGGKWYSFGSGQSYRMTGINGTWAAETADTYTGQGDLCLMGSRLIRTKPGLNGAFMHDSTGVYATTNFGTNNNFVVSNAAGTKVVAGLDAGAVYTSTDGINYTSSTPTGFVGSGVRTGEWNVPLSAYLFINDTGKILTSPDGIAYTDRGSIGAGITAVYAAPVLYSDCKAYSSTSNVFINNMTVNGITEPYIIRTTGTSHTMTKMTTAFSLNAAQTATNDVRLTYIGGKYICIANAKSGDPSSICYQSVDDGVTWTKLSLPVNQVNTTSPIRQLIGGNGIIVSVTDDSNKLVAVHSSTSATHAGVTLKSTNITSSGAIFPNYMRIK